MVGVVPSSFGGVYRNKEEAFHERGCQAVVLQSFPSQFFSSTEVVQQLSIACFWFQGVPLSLTFTLITSLTAFQSF
jgi:hypothetical protein